MLHVLLIVCLMGPIAAETEPSIPNQFAELRHVLAISMARDRLIAYHEAKLQIEEDEASQREGTGTPDRMECAFGDVRRCPHVRWPSLRLPPKN